MSSASKYDVFISHARADAKIAEELALQLADRGLTVFLDRWVLQPGDSFPGAMNQALKSSTAVVALVSPSTAENRGMQIELASAQARARTGGSLLIPVLVGNAQQVPMSIRKFQYVRADDASGIAKAAEEIALSVRSLAPSVPNAVKGGMPRSPVNYFDTGEATAFIETLTSALAAGAGPIQVIGMGGSGKTTLVAEVCRRLADQLSFMWFVPVAAQEEQVVSSLATLAVEMGIQSRSTAPEQLATRALTVLNETDQRWLIVYDEADSAGQHLERWLPQTTRAGTAILIVRAPLQWLEGHSIHYHMSRFTSDWSINFLERELSEEVRANLQSEDLEKLADIGGGLPLVLNLIAANLNADPQATRSKVNELLDPAWIGRKDLKSALSATLSYARSLSPASEPIMRLLPWLSDSPFPIDALVEAAEDGYISSSHSEVERVIRLLEGIGLIEVTSGHFSVHEAVRAALRIPNDPRSLEFLGRATAGYLDSQTNTPIQQLDWLGHHVLGFLVNLSTIQDADSQAEILNLSRRLARYLVQAQSFESAYDLLQQTLADSDRILGPDHPSTLTTRANLAGVLQDLGRSQDAAVLLEQTLADCIRVLGPNDALTIAVRTNLDYIKEQPHSGGANV